MKRFSITVRTPERTFDYCALAETSVDAAFAAYDEFGPCGVTVRSLA